MPPDIFALNGGMFGASVPHSAVRWPIRFVSIPGEPGRDAYVVQGRMRERLLL